MSDDQAPSSGRVRRRAVKRIDYAKQQDFSDEDIFEDSEEEPVKPAKKGRSSRGSATPKSSRTSHAPLTLNEMDDDEESVFDNKPVYTEKGYDPSLPPIRERFPFLPEYEEDGSPRIELIVGRRPVEEKEDALQENGEDEENGNGQNEAETPQKRSTRKRGSPTKESPKEDNNPTSTGPVEYEYLVKYKGKSYLHLEWKTGADLESMNKSAKGIYRRWLKKLAAGTEEDLESPDFDPAFVTPEKIIDEAEQEVVVDLTDKELLRWEKEREKELAEDGHDEDDDENGDDDKKETNVGVSETDCNKTDEEKKDDATDASDDWPEDEVDFAALNLDRLRKIINREGVYYPAVPGSDNPYRDGYIKEQPRKPRASYLFFQGCMRSYYQKRNPEATQSELMTMMGNKWQSMNDEEREPFLQLAREESKQYDKERSMMEKAQKPNSVWQPLRRCRMVLERLAKDSFADIFLEPVDVADFPDYDEVIDTPMDIGTVRTKLETKKYQAPEQFARDMRKIWNNCKIYNQHGSAIWHVADYMSKQFERLYNAWVLEFRERYLRWADPRARPWEHSCRMHDGKCGCPANEIVLCDHCDAMYGFKCLKPPLKKVPTKAWHCAECKPKLKSAKGARMLSAVAENAARKRAEYGDLPKKKVKQTMFLVKWAGLGYEFCTWETREDVNDDELIASFRRLNKGIVDDSELPEDTIENFLNKVRHVDSKSAGGNGTLSILRAQLYAQTRAAQFSKFGLEIPDKVARECGPATQTLAHQRAEILPNDENACQNAPREIVSCVYDMVGAVERGESPDPFCHKISMPPPLVGEYDAIVPITSKGLLLNVGEVHGSVAFLGYRQFPDGSRGPAEEKNIIRNVGDKIIAVDGKSTVDKSFKEVIAMLRESAKNRYAYMRFLENRFSVCESDIASMGTQGRYTVEALRQRFASERQKAIIQRIEQGEIDRGDDIADAKTDTKKEDDSEEETDEGSEGEFEPESDDEELVVTGKAKEVVGEGEWAKAEGAETSKSLEEVNAESGGTTGESTVEEVQPNVAAVEAPEEKITGRLCREETTRSLAFRLLDMDVGYSSDEGGEDDRAFFIDGVDQSFARQTELHPKAPKPETASLKKEEKETKTIPARQNEFMSLGNGGKLSSSIALTSREPDIGNFDNFPFPSSKELELMKQQEEEFARKQEEMSPSKNVKRSTVKIEQISPNTGEVVHIWANAEAAAATLQIRLDQLRQILSGEYDEEIGEEVGGYKWRYAVAGAKVTAGNESASRGGGGKKAKEAWLEFRDKLYDPAEPHVYKNNNRLRDYQVDGVNWLASTWYKKQSCILADEMGLGKTVQIVCYLEHLFRVEQIRRPYLVVVPLSTVEHWRREFEGWTDMICCVYHDRQRVWRDVMREYEWYYKDKPHTPEFLKFDVLVTTYDTLISDFDIVSQIPFRVAVVDEAHRLRNQKGKLLECMREISAKGTMEYGFQSRVLMSGTPLQNSLEELWTLLNFIEPYQFPDLVDFKNRFGNMASQSQVESLQQMISPYMLRRVKEDVAKDIPAKEETVIDVELTSIQKQYYRAIFEHNHAFLSIGATRQSAPKLMNIQMELRKVCNHPFLLENVEHRETDRKYKEFLENGDFEGKSLEERQHMLNENGYVMTSGKMVLMDKLLPKLRQEGHKVLIFSQMVKMLDLLSEYCDFRDFNYERLDGRIRGVERQKAIDRFETNEDSFIFMLSTRAGGVGINLTAADICIIFDSDWNPQNDVQAQARCHRIGQSKEVKVIRLITSRSFEQEMFERASRKLGLEQAVLGTFEKDKDDGKPTQKEMEQLLKRGAYALLEDDNDEQTQQFCADDIDTILAKRSRTRVVEGPKTSSWLNKTGMAVSKSKFSAESGSNELDMDDPLFWQKVLPDFVTPTLLLKKLNDLTDEIDGKVRGPGRGRGRWKKKAEAEQKEKEAKEEEKESSIEEKESTTEVKPSVDAEGSDDSSVEDPVKKDEREEDGEGAETLMSNETLDDLPEDEEGEGDRKNKPKVQLSRTHIKKVLKFMSDLKSMMQTIIDDDEEELQPDEKSACQKLLLTVSVKEKVFNEEQRRDARLFLKKLEGDRRRRCRTSEQPRFGSAVPEDDTVAVIPEHLRIASRKRRGGKKRKSTNDEADDTEQAHVARKRARKSEVVDEDGYLRHSDSEGDWSDVADDLYSGASKKKDRISRKEANRRRSWGADDDVVTAAGRQWPVFPRHVVHKVLSSVLDEVIAYDEKKGGAFSEPVPKDEFPDYYEKIKQPMDYGTMRTKLENGEYRSAQQMQKDFVLILKNCRQYNAPSSDIVREARQQHMMRPKVLKEAAAEHNLFLAEDGSVLEIIDEDKSPKKKRAKKAASADENGDDEGKKKKPKAKKKKDSRIADNAADDDVASTDAEADEEAAGKKKPRIRIKLSAKSEDGPKSKKKGTKRKSRSSDADDEEHDSSTKEPVPKKQKTKVDKGTRKRAAKKSNGEDNTATKETKAKNKPKESKPKSRSIFLNASHWKKGRMDLDKSFDSARAFMTSRGPWTLPSELPDDKFKDVAVLTLERMGKVDKYSVFAEPVTEDEAPDYFDVISNSMDFGTMLAKVEAGDYGTGSKAASKLYKDFLLVFDNCYKYNEESGEIVEEASRILGYVPEAYVNACLTVLGEEAL